MNSKITALIVTYQRPRFLKRAILSVIGQTYKNIKISIFDDASGDETKDFVSELSQNDKRVSYHCHSKNIGALANFRHAFESVDTPYFSILSDDDCLAMDFYENAIEVLDNNPKIMFVILNTLMIDKDSNLKSHVVSTNQLTFHSDIEGFDDFHSGKIPLTWTAMVFRKDLVDIYKEMDESIDIGHDIRFLVRAASRHSYAYLSKVGAFFTQHSGSISSTIKNVDLVHQGVQISRYIEIFHDKSVKPDIKNRTIFYIKKLLTKKPDIKKSIIEIMKNFIAYSDMDNKKIKSNISDFKYAGYLKTSLFLRIFHENKLVRIFVILIFGKFYKKRLINKHNKMLAFQNGIYKDYFEYIKKT